MGEETVGLVATARSVVLSSCIVVVVFCVFPPVRA